MFKVQKVLKGYYEDLGHRVALLFPVDAISDLVDTIDQARINGKKVYIIGNGGSSATASHFAGDLGKGASNDTKPPILAYCLSDNSPAVTAWANDTSYSNIFAGQLDGRVEKGDVLVAISVGGNSPNLVHGMAKAKEQGAACVAIVGRDGGNISKLADITVLVPTHDTERAEDMHSIVCHSTTMCLRNME